MVFESQEKNHDVINVDQGEYPKEWRKNILHYLLENAGTIFISKRHSDKLAQSSMSSES
jgi:hypothetical protein